MTVPCVFALQTGSTVARPVEQHAGPFAPLPPSPWGHKATDHALCPLDLPPRWCLAEAAPWLSVGDLNPCGHPEGRCGARQQHSNSLSPLSTRQCGLSHLGTARLIISCSVTHYQSNVHGSCCNDFWEWSPRRTISCNWRPGFQGYPKYMLPISMEMRSKVLKSCSGTGFRLL